MKKILKRLLLPIGFIPVFYGGCILWIFTGYSPADLLEKFIDYCTK